MEKFKARELWQRTSLVPAVQVLQKSFNFLGSLCSPVKFGRIVCPFAPIRYGDG